ncbi:hypothetical protein [Nocardia sp. alder85J]|uniref:hypothetical protein n=1 Tax=Nocardia sp. alder85J TaxID=2862949 RepID=UPI001CD7D52A|nr:hypothetical protein [Nocardia sp. alder85J]MCX4099222.1 hypothetical protein [Nocardia sp. alder85J]
MRCPADSVLAARSLYTGYLTADPRWWTPAAVGQQRGSVVIIGDAAPEPEAALAMLE